jgi:hypothetical protein
VIADAIPPTIAWAATGYKLASLRRTRSPAGRALLGMLLWLSLATTAFAPPVYRAIDEVTGVPNLAILLAQSFGLILLWPARSLLVYQREDPRTARLIVRRRYRYLAPCLVLSALCWAWAAVPVTDPQYVLHQADNPRAVAFVAVHHLALLLAGIDAIGPGWRVGTGMRDEFRIGMRLVAAAGVGAILLVTYNATTYFAAALANAPPLWLWGDAATIMAMNLHTSTSLLAIGATVPAWGPRLLRWARAGWALHRLRPMWRSLVLASPGVVPPSQYGVLDFRNRLRRRVTGIRDAWLALRGYVTSSSSPPQSRRRTSQPRTAPLIRRPSSLPPLPVP